MISVNRFEENPILSPEPDNPWEADSVFNGCPVADKNKIRLLYRAVSSPVVIEGREMQLSTIGQAVSGDGLHFRGRRQFIRPEFDWEKFGCEDPRVTKLDGKFYIFYTALSQYPFAADGIRVGLAITRNFKKIDAKHPVTPFNAKAMALFPEKIGGKFVVILTLDTDRPPAKIALAFFDKEEDMWSLEYWNQWYAEIDKHILHLRRNINDQIEVGAPPLKTKKGWLIIYSYIQRYLTPPAKFGIEAFLLDLKDPSKIISKTDYPLMTPHEEFEVFGKVPNVVFPSGALKKKRNLNIYYGAADSVCAAASFKLTDLLKELVKNRFKLVNLERFSGNPILMPQDSHSWEAKSVFNPGIIYAGGKIHFLYRAVSEDNISSIGYASSLDGYTISERSSLPVYVPRADFEKAGCEDPRLTMIDNRIYMCYTAFDGTRPRVALTSILLKDFLEKRWNWSKPLIISPWDQDDKDAAIFPQKIKGKYAILHRLGSSIWLDLVNDLKFSRTKRLHGKIIINPREGDHDSRKIGIAGSPIETKFGWLLIYHGVSRSIDRHYHMRAALLDLKDPSRVILRTKDPIFEPQMSYEKEGIVPNVVFSCGAVVVDNTLFIYYGGGDRVISVATVNFAIFLKKLLAEKTNSA